MATNNRPLKAYVRYDGSGRAVSSSLIWRKNKPKVGNWKEVQGYECCNDYSTSFTLQGTESAINFVTTLYLKCNNLLTGVIFSGWGVPAGDDVTIQEFIDILNTSVSSNVATFSWGGGTTVNVQLSYDFKNSICPNGTLTITYPVTPP
jgi:predicted heme/steroid binding protein